MGDIPADMMTALDAFDKACEVELAAFVRELEAEEPPPMLFHYTDDAGFKGILEYGNIRLTNVVNLNDPAEFKHGFSHAIEATLVEFSGMLVPSAMINPAEARCA
jgi:hypothetical protein